MKNKDAIIVILLVLVLVIAVTAVIYISIVKTSQNNVGTSNVQNNATTNDPTTEKVPTNNSEVENNKPQTSDKTETNTKLEQAYKKYSNLQWQRETTATDSTKQVTVKIDTNSGTVKLKDTYSTAGKEQTVAGISNAKYVSIANTSSRGFYQAGVITKDGTVFIGSLERDESIKFEKINLSEKVVDMTVVLRLNSSSNKYYNEHYFLTESGNLINANGEAYEKRLDQVYEKYSNLKWERETTATDSTKQVTVRIDTNSGTVKLKDTYSTAGKEQTVAGISNAKYVSIANTSSRGFYQAGVITKDGTVFIGSLERDESIKFEKINLSEKVVDMTVVLKQNDSNKYYNEHYFLTESGNLINAKGEAYEQ